MTFDVAGGGPSGEFLPPIESFFFVNPETVCAPDERLRVSEPHNVPWSANCRLIITMSNGQRAIGTGWLLGPRLVVTAGHCVHEGEGGTFFKQVEVIPAANGDQQPFGSQTSTDLRASRRWRSSGALADDYGAVILATPFNANGLSPATHTMRVAPDRELRQGDATVAGYPADKPPATQWTDSDPLSSVLPTRLRYYLDTYGGQSGSAVIHTGSVVGIHNYGGCPNYSTRITSAVHAQILRWLAESAR